VGADAGADEEAAAATEANVAPVRSFMVVLGIVNMLSQNHSQIELS
jgi:hypothetical protein